MKSTKLIKAVNLFLTTLLITFVFISKSFAQKVNPDFTGVIVKNKIETIYKSKNSSEDLKNVKAVTDSKGRKYVLFCDGNLGTAYLATGGRGNWKTEVVSGTESDSPTQGEGTRYLAMAVDKNDDLHIILVGYPGTMYYGYRSSVSAKWDFTIVSRDEMPQLHNFYIYQNYIDMAVDNNLGVHIIARADIDNKGHSAIYFYKTAIGKWSSELIRKGVNDTKKDYGTDPSIIVNDNKVITSFGGGWTLTLAEKTIGTYEWSINELLNHEKKSEPIKKSTSLALSPDKNPVVSFMEYQGGELRGINVITKKECSDKWIRSAVYDESSNSSSVAVDKYGVLWLGYCNDGGYTKLVYRSCNADRNWKQALKLNDESKIYLDLFIDNNNRVHLFYSTYKNEIKHIEAWYDGEPEIDNNLLPYITSRMKPHIKAGKFWKTTLKAVDPECDHITFYSENLPAGFTLADHKNGLATLRSDNINEPGEYQIKIFVTDDKHPKGKRPVSGISVKLVVSKDGKKKGSYKFFYDEGSFSKNKWMNLDGIQPETKVVETSATPEKEIKTETKIEVGASVDCIEYLDRYEAWADKYIVQKKKLNSNPMDFTAATKIASMSVELGNWAMEWKQKHECGNNEEFVNRYEKISNRINEVNK